MFHFHSSRFSTIRRADTLLEDRNVEIDEKAQRPFPQAQIGQHLGFVYRLEPIHRFQLDHHLVVHEKVEPVTAIQPFALVTDRQRVLAPVGDAVQIHFVGQARFIGRFQQSRFQRLVNLHRGADDSVSDLVDFHLPGFTAESAEKKFI